MNKLGFLWESRYKWEGAFTAWKVLMYPHLYPLPVEDWCWDDEKAAALIGWIFWEELNNWNNDFD